MFGSIEGYFRDSLSIGAGTQMLPVAFTGQDCIARNRGVRGEKSARG